MTPGGIQHGAGLVQRDKLESDWSVIWPLVTPRRCRLLGRCRCGRTRSTAVAISHGSDQDPEEQWLFQFHEHMLLTVQAIHRLHQAISEKMLGHEMRPDLKQYLAESYQRDASFADQTRLQTAAWLTRS